MPAPAMMRMPTISLSVWKRAPAVCIMNPMPADDDHREAIAEHELLPADRKIGIDAAVAEHLITGGPDAAGRRSEERIDPAEQDRGFPENQKRDHRQRAQDEILVPLPARGDGGGAIG